MGRELIRQRSVVFAGFQHRVTASKDKTGALCVLGERLGEKINVLVLISGLKFLD